MEDFFLENLAAWQTKGSYDSKTDWIGAHVGFIWDTPLKISFPRLPQWRHRSLLWRQRPLRRVLWQKKLLDHNSPIPLSKLLREVGYLSSMPLSSWPFFLIRKGKFQKDFTPSAFGNNFLSRSPPPPELEVHACNPTWPLIVWSSQFLHWSSVQSPGTPYNLWRVWREH